MPDDMKSHRRYRAEIRKQKRKLKRQKAARAKASQITEPESDDSPEEDIQEVNHAEAMRILAHEQWLERERLAQLRFEEKKRKLEAEQKRKEEEELRIRKEWEDRQKKEEEEAKKKKEIEDKRKEKQDQLLRQATANEAGDWSNPLAPRQNPGVERKIAPCPFFSKVAACRFGDRCSRRHDVPDTSTTLVFPGMYCHYSLDQALRGEYDVDVNLEYEDSETNAHFAEFYKDVLPEFRKAGTVTQFKVCRNYEPHLKGNVYVQYTAEDEALRAFALFNARWYGGKQLSGRFVTITSWKSAICGQYYYKKCVKGRNCNFMHVFLNPNGEFREADRDFLDSVRSQRQQSSRRDQRNGSRARSRSRDRSRWTISRARSRSRSPSVRSWRGDSRQRDINSRSRESRQRSRSRERDRRSRSRDRSKRPRSRSCERSKRPRSRSRERSNRPRSRSRERSKRPRSRSRESSKRPRSRSRERSKRPRSKSRERSRSRGSRKPRSSRSRSRERARQRSRERRESEARSAAIKSFTSASDDQ